MQHRVLAAPLSPPQWSETVLYLHALLSKSVYTSSPDSYTFCFREERRKKKKRGEGEGGEGRNRREGKGTGRSFLKGYMERV